MTSRFEHVVRYGRGVPFGIGAIALLSLAALPFRQVLPPSSFMIASMLVIVSVARFSGVTASSVAALAAFLALDVFFVAPYYRLTVSKLPDLLALLSFLVVALVAGQQTGQLRKREQAAVQRQAELELLNQLSGRIASSTSAASIARFVVDQISDVLATSRVAFYVAASAGHAPHVLAESGDAGPHGDEAHAVTKAMRGAYALGLPDSGGGPSALAVVPVGVDAPEGALAAVQTNRAWTRDEQRLLVAVANLAAASLERLRLLDGAARAEALAEADRLKSTFVSSVSHELKTPLAAATMRVTGLIEEGPSTDPARVQAELGDVAAELRRLDASIGDLLVFSRLESDSWRPHLEPQEVSDAIGVVVNRLPAAQAARVCFEIEPALPLVSIDISQLSRAFANLLDNALAYSPAGSSVSVGAGRVGSAVRLWVEDAGPGIADEEKPLVLQKFYRGVSAASVPSGTGLGLAIAAEIVRAHSGELFIEDAQPCGTRAIIVLPALEGSE